MAHTFDNERFLEGLVTAIRNADCFEHLDVMVAVARALDGLLTDDERRYLWSVLDQSCVLLASCPSATGTGR